MERAALILAVATASALLAVYGAHTLDRAEAEPVDPARAASLQTEAPRSSGSNFASLNKGPDGHYWADAQVDGRRVRFLVDTGASIVALTDADARRLGIRMNELTFDQPVSTAGGRAMAAPVTLDYVSVSGARIEDVDALVMREGLDTSLLGMTYLGRLSKFEATRDRLILRR